MRFKFFILFFLISNCTSNFSTINYKKTYTAKGFAYIYNDYDFNEKIIKGKMNNEIMQISHQNLRTGTMIKISNPKNKQSLRLKNVKRIGYPDFYKIILTKPVAEKLKLKTDFPIVEVTEIKKNKSFVAKKAKIYSEEKRISSKAPVANVQISNISKNKKKAQEKNKDEVYILIATFYSNTTANFLKKRIIEELPILNPKKIKIKKISDKETQVITGPYNAVNLVKNDYIILKNFGFEELDIYINE